MYDGIKKQFCTMVDPEERPAVLWPSLDDIKVAHEKMAGKVVEYVNGFRPPLLTLCATAV